MILILHLGVRGARNVYHVLSVVWGMQGVKVDVILLYNNVKWKLVKEPMTYSAAEGNVEIKSTRINYQSIEDERKVRSLNTIVK